jgi:hypothetical protein
MRVVTILVVREQKAPTDSISSIGCSEEGKGVGFEYPSTNYLDAFPQRAEQHKFLTQFNALLDKISCLIFLWLNHENAFAIACMSVLLKRSSNRKALDDRSLAYKVGRHL